MYLTAISVIAMAALALRRRGPSRAFWIAPLVLVAQIALGAINVWAGKHAGLIIGHLALGTTLWATVVYATATLMPASAAATERVAQPQATGGAPADGERHDNHPIALARERSLGAVVRDYIVLTKPRIISLLLLTTVATMIVADRGFPPISTLLWTMLGGYLAAGGAGAINHYIDRDRDARMVRTRGRPLVSGRIEPLHGLVFGIALGTLATIQLAVTVNALAAALALAGLLGYVFIYTIWLKPLTPQNIVIGGAAGAVPPLVGWAAATGGLAPEAFWPFGIVFLWTPPHFWALSLLIKDDYARTGVPMLPVVKGERRHPPADRRLRGHPRGLHARPRRYRLPGRPVRHRGARARRRVRRPGRAPAPPSGPRRRPAALPVLARLPGPALLRHGRRRPPLIRNPPDGP